MIDQLLRFSFREPAFLHVALDVDVEEGRDAPDAHRRAVLRLDGGEVAEVEPLHGLLRRPSWTRDVEAVDRRHLLHAAERTDLLGHFLAQADDVVGHDAVRTDFRMVGLLRLDEAVDAVERDAAVVADDAPAAIGVGQPRDDVAVARAANLRRVGIEDRLVVRLVVLREDFVQTLARFVAVVPARLFRHLDAAVGHEGTLQRLVRLQADDSFQIFERFVDISRAVRGQTRDDVRVHVEHAALPALGTLQLLQLLPEAVCRLRRRSEEIFRAVIGRVVPLHEVANIDLLLPKSAVESLPLCLGHWKTSRLRCPLSCGSRMSVLHPTL